MPPLPRSPARRILAIAALVTLIATVAVVLGAASVVSAIIGSATVAAVAIDVRVVGRAHGGGHPHAPATEKVTVDLRRRS